MFSIFQGTTRPVAQVSTIDQQVAELYWKTQAPGSVLAVEYDAGWFGSKIAKAVGKVAKGVAKVAVAPVTHTVTLARDIGSGKNVIKSAVKYVKSDLATAKTVAPYVQAVVSFVPGIGTAASMGLGAASAALQGKSLAEIAKDTAKGAIPGGPIVATAAMTVASMAAAGVQGKNIAKAAANELASGAADMIPNPQLAAVLKSAAAAGINGQNMLKGAKAGLVQQALNAIPDVNARAAAAAVVSGKSPGDAVKAAGAQFLTKVAAAPGKSATASIVQAVQIAAQKVAPVKPSLSPVLRSVKPSLPIPATMARGFSARLPKTSPVVNRIASILHRPVTSRARSFLSRFGPLSREVSGLTPDGKWLVQSGDTGSSIAKALTGNANRWTELKAVNPQVMKKASAADIAKYGFPMPYAGNVINLPASWVKPAVIATPVPAPTAAPTVLAQSTMPGLSPAVILANLPTVLAPSGDQAAQSQARVMLAAWGRTDGANQAGLPDYGGPSELGATAWTSRDVLQAASFENWWNRTFRPGAPFPETSGQWTQDLNDGLHAWTEAKAAQVLPGLPVPTITAAPTTVQTPTVTVTPATSTIPASGGTPAIQLPGITITGGGATQVPGATQAQPKTSEPTGFAKWWTDNKGAAIPGLIGLGVSYGSKFL